ncbi:MAG TPA: phosphoribosylaminoimidazolesuccinocarboxamide synthase [Nitrososphaerales archaeon]|nr:phosphoribosylaminoimidazolesuccinocarboxamide synthase [Nitrososphaerales archaeon]
MSVLMESNLTGMTLLKRGKVRDVYVDDGELLIVATDRISAFDRVMPIGIPDKGASLTKLSEFWFLRTRHIFKNHFISRVDSRTLRVKKAQRIDIEWICRAYLYGSAWRAYSKGAREISGVGLPSGLQLAEELPEVILTPTTKSEEGHDTELSKQMAIEQGLVDGDVWNDLEEATYGLFEYYKREARVKGIIIPDFKLEYGKLGDELIQIDEPPTHDSARFWSLSRYHVGEKQEKHCLDKEFLRDFLMRKGFSGDGEVPELPDLVIQQITKRCQGAYEVISGLRTLDSLSLLSVDEVLAELEKSKTK